MKKVKRFSRRYLWRGILIATTITAICGFLIFNGIALANATITSVTLDGGATVIRNPGTTISARVDVTTSGSGTADDWKSTAWRIGSGSFACVDTGDYTNDGSYHKTFNITAPLSYGTYNAEFIAYNSNDCTTGDSATLTLTNAVTVLSFLDKSPSSVVDDVSIGSETWQHPDRATTNNGSYATVTLDSAGETSHYLKATGFGFNISDGATINGIEVTVERSQDNDGTNRIFDNSVRLVKGGTIIAASEKSTGILWPKNDATITYGSATDTWGQIWTASDINDLNTGFTISAIHDSSSSSRTPRVDYINMTVYYTATHTITASAGAGGTITPSGTITVSDGISQTFTTTLNTGYIVSDVLVDTISQGRINSYTFPNVTVDHTISASFDGGWSVPASNAGIDGSIGNPTYAYSSNDQRAEYNSNDDVNSYYGFGSAVVPSGATINGIEVSVEGQRDSGSTRTFDVKLSYNGGTNWTPTTPKNTGDLGTTDSTVILGGSSNNWGYASWTPAIINSNNFRIKMDATSGGDSIWLDQIQVKVYYIVCGNGVVEGTEVCDDSNTNNGDGCSSVCTVESGYNCAGSPSACTPDCSGVGFDDCNAPTQGTCVAPDTCSCVSGWTGANCNTPDCSSLNNCNGHGDCTGPNTCTCYPIWQGADCSQPVCVDVDGDGYGSPASASCTHPELVDCNDNNAAIYPGATETCDNQDNDCNGAVDEGLTRPTTCGLGACSGNIGVETCTAGVWGDNTCNPLAGATTEVCEGSADENCNGTVDDGCQCTDGVYQCGQTDVGECTYGTQTCSGGVLGSCIGAVYPTAEICDALDNNCDGSIADDGIGESWYQQATSCGVGECASTGMFICQGAAKTDTCQAGAPTAELCDNKDNDCDSSIDEGLIRSYYTGPAGTENVGECKTGTETCSTGIWSVTTPEATPSSEVCDALDNNCDGSIADDGIGESWYQQATSCGVGECASTGMFICQASAKTDTCQAGAPTAELCDNKDNDCDGSTDEDLTQATTCGVGACLGNTGTETCTAGVWGGDTCSPYVGATTEVCNEVDDNCDGTVDGNWVCDITPPTITINDKLLVANASELVSFSATATDDSSGVAGVGWTFGDDGTATGTETAHTYTADGAYSVTATATDNSGKTATDTAKVIIGQMNFTPDGVPDANLTFNNLPGGSFTFTAAESDTTSVSTSGFLVGGKFYEFTSSLTDGNFNATITFKYADADNDGIVDGTSINENDLDVYYWDGSAWTVVSNPVRDAVNNTITVTVDHFTQFGLMFPAPASTPAATSSPRGGGGSATPKEVKGEATEEEEKPFEGIFERIAEAIGIPGITGETPEETTEEGTPSSPLAQEKTVTVLPQRGLASLLAALGMVIGQSAWKMIFVILSLAVLMVIGVKEWKKARERKKR